MNRSELTPMPVYFDRYINKTDDVDVISAIKISITELENAPLDRWEQFGDNVYAPGKWTIKDILQHMIDTERIFSYRATAFARGDADVKSYDEDMYAKAAKAQHRSLTSLVDELIALRKSFLHLYQSFTPEMLTQTGNGFKGKYSVHDIGFIIPGHQRWHFDIIIEKYNPLI